MSGVEVIAIEPVNGHHPGSRFGVSEREAQQMVDKGLVKMAGPVSNKMRAEPANKADPSPAAGAERPSSASRVARASKQTTAKKSAAGKKSEPKADE